MAVRFAGGNFDLHNDQNILTINSPQNKIFDRIHVVVYKDEIDRWCVVALDYSDDKNIGNPRLGLRWFWSKFGFPNSRQFATWIVLPPSISDTLMKGGAFGLPQEKIRLLKGFLDGQISGTQLKRQF